MAGRNANISVKIEGEAEFDKARADAKDAISDIEKAGTVELSAELDTAQIRQAIDLAKTLDGLTAELTVDADISQIVEAEKLAKSLRGFQARVDLSVEGQAELKDALNLSEQMDRIRTVRLEVQGRQDLERAAEIADDLERRRSVPIDAQASDLQRLDDQVGDALTRGGEAGADGVAGALSDIDFTDIGSSGADKLTGALAAAGPWAAVGGAVGAVFGDEFLEGFNNALPTGRDDTIRALRTNLSESELAAVGEAGGAAYSSGLAEGLTGAKDTAAALQGQLGKIDDDLDLKEVTRQAAALEQVFGVDMTESINAVAKLVSQGLVKNSQEGFDLLFTLGQQTQGQFDEMLTSTDEFSTSIKALGIEGPKGLQLIGEMIRTGIFEQADQAGEVFSELNETIISGGAAEALSDIHLNAEAMTKAIAGGGPKAAEAVAQIAQQLLTIDDNAEQAQATAAIFGGNMGLLGDEAREAALQLFATADGTAEFGTAASDAATSIEESATGLDRLKKIAVDLGEELGTTAADAVDLGTALADADWDTVGSKVASLGDTLAIKLGGPLADIADRVGLDPLGPLKDSFDELFGSADELPPKLASTSDGLSKTSVEAEGLGRTLSTAAEQADELESQLSDLFDFGADQMLRDIADAGDDLTAAFEAGAAKTVGFNGEIDITTKTGRDLQATMEGLNGTLVDAAVAFTNGEISADQYASIQSSVQSQLDATSGKAGLTADKVQGLTNKYLDQEGIDSITTDLLANDLATGKITALQRALAALPTTKTITVTTINQSVGASATVKMKAKGGWTEGLTLVGEEGPELIDVKGRAFVHTAGETQSILSNRGGDLSGAPALTGIGGGPRINIERLVVDKGVDLWQQLDLAEMVYGHR